MELLEIIPHKSFGSVQLGMHRDEVRSALGRPCVIQDAHVRWDINFPDKDYFLDNAYQVHYDAEQKAEFISASTSIEARITLADFAISDSTAEEILRELEKVYELRVEEGGCSVILATADVSFWRSDSESKGFESVGVGIKNYFGTRN